MSDVPARAEQTPDDDFEAESTPVWTAPQRPEGTWQASLLALLLLAALCLAQGLPLLSRAPRMIMDEAWESCTGYALVEEGRLRNPIIHYRGDIDKAFVQPRITQSFVLAGAYQIFGFSLHTGRLASVLVGLLAAWGVFYLARTWLTVGGAMLLATLFLLETQYVMVARMARPEVYLICASVWSLGFLARGTTYRNWWLVLLAGIVGGVGCYTHPNMIIFALAGVALIFAQVGVCGWTLAAIGLYALGGILGVVPFFVWVGYAHAVHGVSFWEQLGHFYTHTHEESLAAMLRREMLRWWSYLRPVPRAPWLGLALLGLIFCRKRERAIMVWAVILIIAHALFLPLLNRSGSPRYLTVLSPWFAGLIAVFILATWSHVRQRTANWQRWSLRVIAVGGALGAIAINIAGTVVVLRAYRDADYDAFCARIAENIPPGSRVYGNLFLWIGLHEYPFFSDINQEFLPKEQMEPTVLSWLSEFRPQYAVRSTDPCWEIGGLSPRRQEADFRGYGVSGLGMQLKWEAESKYLRHRGQLLDRIESRDFGTVEVYRIR